MSLVLVVGNPAADRGRVEGKLGEDCCDSARGAQPSPGKAPAPGSQQDASGEETGEERDREEKGGEVAVRAIEVVVGGRSRPADADEDDPPDRARCGENGGLEEGFGLGHQDGRQDPGRHEENEESESGGDPRQPLDGLERVWKRQARKEEPERRDGEEEGGSRQGPERREAHPRSREVGVAEELAGRHADGQERAEDEEQPDRSVRLPVPAPLELVDESDGRGHRDEAGLE